MDLVTLGIFSVTTAASCFSPGPAAILVASTSASSGRSQIAPCVLGISLANLVYFLLAASGVAGVISAFPKIFNIVRIVGALYLINLGYKMLVVGAFELRLVAQTKVPRWKSFYRSFAVEISNPKAILYFGALLPLFLNSNESLNLQLAIFAAITLFLDLVAYSVYGYIGLFSSTNLNQKAWQYIMRFSGALFLVFGGWTIHSVLT